MHIELEVPRIAIFLSLLRPTYNTGLVQGLTPLHMAAHQGHAGIVNQLCRVGRVEVDALDNAGCTPLHHATALGHDSVVMELWSKSANVDLADTNGWTGTQLHGFTPSHIHGAHAHTMGQVQSHMAVHPGAYMTLSHYLMLSYIHGTDTHVHGFTLSHIHGAVTHTYMALYCHVYMAPVLTHVASHSHTYMALSHIHTYLA